jgi:hypothetical protein
LFGHPGGETLDVFEFIARVLTRIPEPRVRTRFRQNWDFAFQKTHLVGRGSVTVRLEVINAFDHPDFGGPANVFGRSDFGKITAVSGFPRLLQIMVRYAW